MSTIKAFLKETPHEYSQDIVFGLAFLAISLFSAFRVHIYFDPLGDGKVITVFYSLIFISSLSRAMWFLIPSSVLEESYAPVSVVAWESRGWFGTLISEILLAVGNLSLYAVFILVTCYWSRMIRKVNIEPLEPHGVVRPNPRSLGAIKLFLIIMSVIIAVQLLNLLLFLSGAVNSEGMILFDSVMLSSVAVITSTFMTLLSARIRVVLMAIGASNASSTRAQANRILAMTRVGNAFFFCRVVIELVFTISCLVVMKGRRSFSIELSSGYWDWYIVIKHFSEIIVLVSQLAISTAIKKYETPRSLPSVALPTVRGFRRRTGHPTDERTPLTTRPSSSNGSGAAYNETSPMLANVNGEKK